MFENDHLLLNTPSLTALILREAGAGPVTADAAAARLADLFGQAHETPALSPGALRDRLAFLIGQLAIARLVEPVPDRGSGGAWRLTPRGAEAHDRHPLGLDLPDLMDYPDYAAHVRATLAGGADDPRAAGYDEGYDARRAGLPFTDNPYAPSTVDHMAWENGWMQAVDDGRPDADNS